MTAPTLSAADDDLYRELQRHFDRMPVPFPTSRSGAELRILRQLYTPDDARVALCLSTIPETAAVVCRRYRRARAASGAGPDYDRRSCTAALDSMAARGLLQRIEVGRRVLYGKTVFVVGFYEAQVNRLTPELQRDVETYAAEAFGAALHAGRTPQLRTVPINESIPFERFVGRYDDIRAFVRNAEGPFAVMNCICQQGKDLLNEPCRQTDHREHCLTIGSAARALVARGDARFISRDEMLAFLDRADREGLVVQPQNTQAPLFICCCCGCCCGVLSTARTLPRPAEFFATNYVAAVEADACHACGACADRCQMDAITFPDGPARIAAERCIGCGLCVTTCPTQAVVLQAKLTTRVPPQDTGRLYTKMYVDRFGVTGLAAAIGKRIVGLRS